MVRRRSRPVLWLAGLGALALFVWLVVPWAIGRVYPIDPYREAIFLRSAENGLDPYLVAAVIRHESRFNPNALSHQGARGLMQVIPDTGRWVAEQVGLPFQPDLLYDPAYNIQIGTWYLAHQLRQFGGSIVLALAAYNGGEQNVRTWLVEDRWTGEIGTVDQIPFPETRSYVQRVMDSYDKYRLLYSP